MTYSGYKFRKPEAKVQLALLLTAITEAEGEGITRRQLSALTGIHLATVTPYTAELRDRGLVHSIRNQYEVRWYLGVPRVKRLKTPSPRYERNWKATQITVSTWAPNHSRDDLVSALFGKPA